MLFVCGSNNRLIFIWMHSSSLKEDRWTNWKVHHPLLVLLPLLMLFIAFASGRRRRQIKLDVTFERKLEIAQGTNKETTNDKTEYILNRLKWHTITSVTRWLTYLFSVVSFANLSNRKNDKSWFKTLPNKPSLDCHLLFKSHQIGGFRQMWSHLHHQSYFYLTKTTVNYLLAPFTEWPTWKVRTIKSIHCLSFL